MKLILYGITIGFSIVTLGFIMTTAIAVGHILGMMFGFAILVNTLSIGSYIAWIAYLISHSGD